MGSSPPKATVLLCCLLLVHPSAFIAVFAAPVPKTNPDLTFHNGPLLKGEVNLALLWYGQFGRSQKTVIRHFIKSLNTPGQGNPQPQVASWWRIVESYGAGNHEPRPNQGGVKVKVVKQTSDQEYSVGKVITQDFIQGLIERATGGNPRLLPVIFTGRMVSVQGLCMGKCSLHGIAAKSNQPYIVAMDPETECPGACAWPFHEADGGPKNGVILRPPNGNVGADSVLISFASSLAGVVTNPFNTGYFEGAATDPLEACTACAGIFGTGAFPGYAGKVSVDPKSGGSFNAHGVNGTKFLLPAVWNPTTRSCWTTM